MTKMIDVKVKDQYSNICNVQALVRVSPSKNAPVEFLELFHRIEHIIVEGEIIRPSIELLFESKNTDSIYRILA